jgi:hypothetical protein
MTRRWQSSLDLASGRIDRAEAVMPHACQNGRKAAVIRGHPRVPETVSDLGRCRLTHCVKRPSKQRFTRAVDLGPRSQSHPADTARQPTPRLWARLVAAGPDETRTSAGLSRVPGRSPLGPLRAGYGPEHRSGLLRRPSMRDGDQGQSPGEPCSHHRYPYGARAIRGLWSLESLPASGPGGEGQAGGQAREVRGESYSDSRG